MQAQLPNLGIDALVDCAGAFVSADAGIEILEDVLHFLYQALRERGVDCEFASCRVSGSTEVGDLDGGFFEQWTCLLYRDMAYTFPMAMRWRWMMSSE